MLPFDASIQTAEERSTIAMHIHLLGLGRLTPMCSDSIFIQKSEIQFHTISIPYKVMTLHKSLNVLRLLKIRMQLAVEDLLSHPSLFVIYL